MTGSGKQENQAFQTNIAPRSVVNRPEFRPPQSLALTVKNQWNGRAYSYKLALRFVPVLWGTLAEQQTTDIIAVQPCSIVMHLRLISSNLRWFSRPKLDFWPPLTLTGSKIGSDHPVISSTFGLEGKVQLFWNSHFLVYWGFSLLCNSQYFFLLNRAPKWCTMKSRLFHKRIPAVWEHVGNFGLQSPSIQLNCSNFWLSHSTHHNFKMCVFLGSAVHLFLCLHQPLDY